ncbi:MAG: cysteine protease StiP domain-containing protein, partial [Oscillospiraceae bacterium]
MNLVRTSYRPEDVTILLKDITGCIEPMSTEQRERKIQSGTHYCEMLPIEYQPSA